MAVGLRIHHAVRNLGAVRLSSMKTKTYPDPKPYPEKVRLVILDLDAFLYAYDKAYRKAVLRAWRSVEKEYGLPILRNKIQVRTSMLGLDSTHGDRLGLMRCAACSENVNNSERSGRSRTISYAMRRR
jgi:hypothetical protein